MKRTEKTIIGKTAAEYCAKYPKMPNRALAKLMRKDHPKLFLSIESARARIRYIRGAMGSENLKRAKSSAPELIKPIGWQKEAMPKSTAEIRVDFVFPKRCRVLILSDIHFPYHDELALKTAIKWGKSKNPTHVLLNGDTVENYGVSRWEPNPEKRDYDNEIKISRRGMRHIRSAFPNAKILFKSGNHEDRLEKFLIKHAEVLHGVDDFKMHSILRLDELKIGVIHSSQIIRIGNLVVIHGHELPKGLTSSVNPARGLYLKLQETSLCGHFHQTSHHSEASGLKKRYISCYSTGCLCDLTPDYAIVNKWNHGCAFVVATGKGNFRVENVKIINGQVY